MSTTILSQWDFTHLELLNVRLQNLASDPSSPQKGWTYFNTGSNKQRVYNGTTWDEAGSGGGSVTSVSVVTANGFAGTVATSTTTPAITLTTSITGLLKGNGTAISAATVGTDYLAPFVSQTANYFYAAPNGSAGTPVFRAIAVGDIPTLNQSTTGSAASFTGALVGDVTGTQGATALAATTNVNTIIRNNRLDQFAAPTADVSLNSHKVTNLLDPTNPQDAATKAYVDVYAQGMDFKNSARVATTANGTLASAYANGSTVDGQTLATGDRILLKNQTTASENGIYTVNATGAPTRATDADASGEISKGALIYIEAGTANSGQLWVCSATGATPWVPGSSTSTWTQFSGATSITAGNGLSLTGSTLAVVAGNGIIADGTSTRVDPAVVVRKYVATIGDGSSTSIAVTHGLGTQDITVSIRDATTNAMVMCDVVSTSSSVVTFGFAVAPATNAYKVVAHG